MLATADLSGIDLADTADSLDGTDETADARDASLHHVMWHGAW